MPRDASDRASKTGEQYVVEVDHDLFAVALDKKDEEDLFSDDGLLDSYERLCLEKVNYLSQSDEGDPAFQLSSQTASIPQWELERSSWKIIRELLQCRLKRDDSEKEARPHDFASDRAWSQYFLDMDSALSEHMTWLEETAPEFFPVEVRKGYLPYTLKALSDAQRRSDPNESQTLVDPDAPTRSGRSLAPDDKTYEASLNRSLFDYIRRGRIQDGMALCRECDHHWKAASLSGWGFFFDPFIDGKPADYEAEGGGENPMELSADAPMTGNINRSLWKFTCYSIARDVLPICMNWEDVLWANYVVLLEQSLEAHLATVRWLGKADDEVKVDLPPPAKSNYQIFEELRRSDKKDIRSASFDPFRIFQSMWILDRLNEFFIELRYQIQGRAPGLPYLPHYLRFITHVILLLRSMSYPLNDAAVDATDFIIQSYVGLLIAAGKYDIVAIFTSQLPNQLQVDMHASMLTNINDDKNVRYKFVQEANNFGLDTNIILLHTVELIFSECLLQEPMPTSVSSVFLMSFLDPIPASDAKQIRALEWLCFDDSQKEDLVIMSNVLLRRFLAHGRLQSAQKLSEIINSNDILRPEWVTEALERADRLDHGKSVTTADPELERLSVEAVEYLRHLDLLKCAKGFASWKALMGSRPARPSGTTKVTYQYRDWVDQVKTLTTRTENSIRNLIESGWIATKEISSDAEDVVTRDREIQFLRDLYLPNLIVWLHCILFETRNFMPGNLKKCHELAEETKNPQDKLYHEVMRSGMITQLFHIFQESATASEDLDQSLLGSS
ncbi:hypothetical protein HDU67_003154 [Dinochytrium kinnereticum]|nr:hypothetical protein HDU67_003154 [Dinochytrium kinnereticum]